MSAIDRLIQDAIDIHVHFGPDPRVERRADAIETVRYAQELGLRALVLKSHEYPTTPVAYTVSQVVPGIEVFGGICLDFEVGGLNVRAVEASAKMGAKVVWMPTFSSASDFRRRGEDGGISVVDEQGQVLPVVRDILEIIRDYNMVLATGHISIQECHTLVEAARGVGIERIVITHASTLARWIGMTVDDMKALAAKGAVIEHSIHAIMPLTLGMDPKEMAEMIRDVGAQHCILSTDFGQAYHPIPAEGLRMAIATLLQSGLTENQVEFLVKRNPARLLGLD